MTGGLYVFALLRLVLWTDGEMEVPEAAVLTGGEHSMGGEGGHRRDEGGEPHCLAGPGHVGGPQYHGDHLAPVLHWQAHLTQAGGGRGQARLVPDVHWNMPAYIDNMSTLALNNQKGDIITLITPRKPIFRNYRTF